MIKYLISIGLFLVATIIGISFLLQPNSFGGCQPVPSAKNGCNKSDAIIVVSGGDTSARTDAGINLYKNGWASTLILSGAASDTSGPSNAATMKARAIQAGVPAEAIIVDEAALNTQQNAEYVNKILTVKGYNNAILVTSGYHQRRVHLEFNRQAPTIVFRNYPVNDKDWNAFWWLTFRGWWLAGGEIVKIIAFSLGIKS